MKNVSRFALGLGTVALGTLALAAPAMATTPTATGTPHTKLVNGTAVKVKWAGFPASGKIAVVQCISKPVAQSDALTKCDLTKPDLKLVTSSAAGAGALTFKVKSTVPLGLTGKTTGACAPKSTKCVLIVGALTGSPAVVIPLAFK